MAGKVSNRNAEDRKEARLVIAREVLKKLAWVTKDKKPCHFTRPNLFASVNAADRYQTNESLSKNWQSSFMRILCNLKIAQAIDDGAGTSGYMIDDSRLLSGLQTHPDLEGMLKYMLWPLEYPLPDKTLIRPPDDETEQEVLDRIAKSLTRPRGKILRSAITELSEAEADLEQKREQLRLIDAEIDDLKNEQEQIQALDPTFVESEPDLTEEEIGWITKYVEELDKVSTNQVIRNALKREPKPGGELNKLVARCLRDTGFRSHMEDKNGRRVKFFTRHDEPAPSRPIPNVPTTVEPPAPRVEKRHIRKEDLMNLVAASIEASEQIQISNEITPGDIHTIVKRLAIDHNLDYIPYGELSDFVHKHIPEFGFEKNGTFTFARKIEPEPVKVEPELVEAQVSPEKTYVVPTISEPNENLFRKVEDVGLSTRIVTSLHAAGIKLVGELIQVGKFELRAARDLGDTSYSHVVEKLKSMGLSLGTRVENWHSMLGQWKTSHPEQPEPQPSVLKDPDLLAKTVRETIGESPCVLNSWLYEKVSGRPSWELTPYEARIMSNCAVDLGFSRYVDPVSRLTFFCIDDVPTKKVIRSAISMATTKTRKEVVESAIMILVDGQPHPRKELFHGNEEGEWQSRILDTFLRSGAVSVSGAKSTTRYTGIASELESLIGDETLEYLINEKTYVSPEEKLLNNIFGPALSPAEDKSVSVPQPSVPTLDHPVEPISEEESTIEDLLDVIRNHTDTIRAMDGTITKLKERIKSLESFESRIAKLEGK